MLRILSALLVVTALALNAPTETVAQQPVAAASAGTVAQWRDRYAADLMRPDGWLSLVALEWLQTGDTTVGSAPDNKIKLQHLPPRLGRFRQASGTVEFIADPGLDSRAALLDGRPVSRSVVPADDAAHPSALTSGDVLMTVIHRGDRYYLRVKDANAPGRLHFTGLAWYPPQPRFRVIAKWVPYAPAKTLEILNVLGQVTEEPSPGYAEFQVDGQTVRLDATEEGDGLFFDFRDTTSRTTTDGTGRFLTTRLPDHGVGRPGTVVVDFNYAHNPPCGYTNFATCPLPPAQNRLPVAIPAGEKRYPGA